MLIVAGIKFDGFALKAEEFSVRLVLVAADVAPQLDNPLLVTLRTEPVQSFVSSDVDKYMVEGTLNYNASLFVCCCCH